MQEVVILKAAAVKEATASILELHSIPASVSKDLSTLSPEMQHGLSPAAAVTHVGDS